MNRKFKQEHSSAIAKQQQHKAVLASIDKLTQEFRALQQAITKAETNLKSYAHAESSLEDARGKLTAALGQRTDIFKRAAARIFGVSNGRVKASVRRRVSRSEECREALEGVLDRAGVVEKSNKVKQRLAGMSESFDAAWKTVGDELIAVFRHKLIAESAPVKGTAQKDVSTSLRCIFEFYLTPAQVQQVVERLDEARVARVFQAAPAEYIEFEYQHDGRNIPFGRASPGQRAAALLFILLEQEAGTLIIDQPEDDLDNRAVMDLVECLRKAKQKRQIVFATHNPNFVVNGDADKVVALGVARDDRTKLDQPIVQIEVDGAIETPGIREAITAILEGGEEAFRLRGRKYDLEVKR